MRSSYGKNGLAALLDKRYGIYREEYFQQALTRERKRSERTGERLILMLLELGASSQTMTQDLAREVVETISTFTRGTDITGWHRHDSSIGVLITDAERNDIGAVMETMEKKLRERLSYPFKDDALTITFHVFPEILFKREHCNA